MAGGETDECAGSGGVGRGGAIPLIVPGGGQRGRRRERGARRGSVCGFFLAPGRFVTDVFGTIVRHPRRLVVVLRGKQRRQVGAIRAATLPHTPDHSPTV